MQAVIETGSKQYLIKEGDEILVEKLSAKEGEEVAIESVLAIIDGDNVSIGQPTVKGASVKAKLVAQEKGEKKISFKFRRRENYKRKVGHRQRYSRIKIEKISI